MPDQISEYSATCMKCYSSSATAMLMDLGSLSAPCEASGRSVVFRDVNNQHTEDQGTSRFADTGDPGGRTERCQRTFQMVM